MVTPAGVWLTTSPSCQVLPVTISSLHEETEASSRDKHTCRGQARSGPQALRQPRSQVPLGGWAPPGQTRGVGFLSPSVSPPGCSWLRLPSPLAPSWGHYKHPICCLLLLPWEGAPQTLYPLPFLIREPQPGRAGAEVGAGTGTLPVKRGQYGGDGGATPPRRTRPGAREAAEKALTKPLALTSPSCSLSQEAPGV